MYRFNAILFRIPVAFLKSSKDIKKKYLFIYLFIYLTVSGLICNIRVLH